MKLGPRPGAGSKGTHASRSEAQPQASIERVSTWAKPHPCSAAALNLVGAPSPEQGEEFRQRRKTRPAPRSWPSEPPRGERPSARRAARQSAATGPRQRVDPAGVHLRSRSAPARLWRFRVRETARGQRGLILVFASAKTTSGSARALAPCFLRRITAANQLKSATSGVQALRESTNKNLWVRPQRTQPFKQFNGI